MPEENGRPSLRNIEASKAQMTRHNAEAATEAQDSIGDLFADSHESKDVDKMIEGASSDVNDILQKLTAEDVKMEEPKPVEEKVMTYEDVPKTEEPEEEAPKQIYAGVEDEAPTEQPKRVVAAEKRAEPESIRPTRPAMPIQPKPAPVRRFNNVPSGGKHILALNFTDKVIVSYGDDNDSSFSFKMSHQSFDNGLPVAITIGGDAMLELKRGEEGFMVGFSHNGNKLNAEIVKQPGVKSQLFKISVEDIGLKVTVYEDAQLESSICALKTARDMLEFSF